jgi:hypothetical protein
VSAGTQTCQISTFDVFGCQQRPRCVEIRIFAAGTQTHQISTRFVIFYCTLIVIINNCRLYNNSDLTPTRTRPQPDPSNSGTGCHPGSGRVANCPPDPDPNHTLGGGADIAGNGAIDDEACLGVAGTILNDPLLATLSTGLYTNSLLFAT